MAPDTLQAVLHFHRRWQESDGDEGERARLADAAMPSASLWRADLREADLNRANLSGANLDHARPDGASLVGADLAGASLWEANLRGADLTRARLCGGKLDHADLRGATLRHADFYDASLWGAHLEGADLRDADGLNEALLGSAALDQQTRLPAPACGGEELAQLIATATPGGRQGSNLSGGTSPAIIGAGQRHGRLTEVAACRTRRINPLAARSSAAVQSGRSTAPRCAQCWWDIDRDPGRVFETRAEPMT